MYIFTRTRSAVVAHAIDAMAFAVDIGQHVTKVTGVDVFTWGAVYGAPVGSLSWSCRAESLAALESMNEQLAADAEFADKVEASQDFFSGPLEDTVVEVIHAVGDLTPGNYTNIITAQCAPGRIGEAVAWAVEAQEASSKLTGFGGAVGRSLWGEFASIGWITPLQSIDQAEAADQAFKDPDFGKLLDGAGGLFLPGATRSRLIRRLG